MSYRVLGRLPAGGFSEIFEVEDPASALPERLILKRLNAEMSARPEVRTAFAEEAKILRELKHPNVVTFRRCYFDESHRICLLMERVAGEPLDAWARRHASQAEVVLDVFERVLQAVDYLHHRPSPFLHLDLKPDNILVSSSPQGPHPVLIDFGIARRSGGQGLRAYTPPYGAPEQAAGGALDCSTDIYALGQILGELLDILRLPDGAVQEALASVVARARQVSRRARFADAGEMGLALRRARRSSPVASQPLSRTWSVPQIPRWAYGAAAAGLGLIALLIFLWPAEAPAPDPASGAAQASEETGTRSHFEEVVSRGREAALEGRFANAEQALVDARQLWRSLPADSEAAKSMQRELDALRSQIDLARHVGAEGARLVE